MSTEEYYDCKLRLETGEARQKVEKSSISFFGVLSALGQDLNYLISDPEVIRRKKLLANEQSQSSLSSRSASSESPLPPHVRTKSNGHSIADDEHLSQAMQADIQAMQADIRVSGRISTNSLVPAAEAAAYSGQAAGAQDHQFAPPDIQHFHHIQMPLLSTDEEAAGSIVPGHNCELAPSDLQQRQSMYFVASTENAGHAPKPCTD